MNESGAAPASAPTQDGSASALAKAVKRALRAVTNEYARAQQAAALAERDHRRPAAMRALYRPDSSGDGGSK